MKKIEKKLINNAKIKDLATILILSTTATALEHWFIGRHVWNYFNASIVSETIFVLIFWSMMVISATIAVLILNSIKRVTKK